MIQVPIEFPPEMSGLRRVDRALERLQRQADSFERGNREAFRQSSQSARIYERDLRNVELRGVRTGRALAGIGRLAAGAFAAIGAAQGIQTIARLGIEAEQTQVAFRTFLGDAAAARDLIADLNKFSTVTPFKPDEVIQSGRALLAFGVEQEKIIPNLRAIGDIAAGVNIPLNELSEIFGKARTQGTLFAEDINQLTGRGVPIIGEFAKQFGVTEAEVKKLGSEGRITFANLEQAFIDLTSEGGTFFNLMEEQSQTVGGRISTLQGNFEALLREIGTRGNETLGQLVDGLNAFVTSLDVDAIFEFFQPITDRLVPALDAMFEAIGNLIDEIFGFNSEAERTEALFAALDVVFNAFIDVATITANGVRFISQSLADLVGWFRETRESGGLLGNVFNIIATAVETAFDSLQKLFGFIRDQFIDDSQELTNELSRQQEQLRESREAMEQSAVALTDVAEETVKTTETVVANRKEVEKLQKAYEKLNSQLEDRVTTARLDLIGDPVERIRAEQQLALDELDNFRQELESAARALGIEPDFEQEFADMAAAIDRESRQAIAAAAEAQQAIFDEFNEGRTIAPVESELIDQAQLDRVKELGGQLVQSASEGVEEESESLVVTFERLKDKIADSLGFDDQQAQAIFSGLSMAFNGFIRERQELLQREIDNQQQIIDSIDEKIGAAESALEQEQQREEDGVANSVNRERERLEELQRQREEAVEKQNALQEKARKEQARIDTLNQVSSLITATANIFKGFSALPIVGQVLAAAAVASMFALFAKSKIDARKTAASFREGGSLPSKLGGKAKGRTHAQGGIKGITSNGDAFEFQGEEFIVNAQAAKANESLLNYLNEGGQVSPIDFGQLAAQSQLNDMMGGIAPMELPTSPSYSDPIPRSIERYRESERRAEKKRKENEEKIMRQVFSESIEKAIAGQTRVLKHAIKTQIQYVEVDGKLIKITPDFYGHTESKKAV